MATGDLRLRFDPKRTVSARRVEDNFFDYLERRTLEVSSRVWASGGIFGSATLVAGGADQFSIQTTPVDFLDGNGNVCRLPPGEAEGVPFENASGVVYQVALRHVRIPKGPTWNPRTGILFYDLDEDRIGDVAQPDSVVEAGGRLTIVVDKLFESGVGNAEGMDVSQAGRKVTVYLRQPRTVDESTAIERDLIVAYAGGHNSVTTTGLLGQSPGAASTNPTDYVVVATGPTVRRVQDLANTSPYAYVGTVTGGGAGNAPSNFSTSGQLDVTSGINPDLGEAYANGRTVTPSPGEGGEVRIATTNSGGPLRAGLAINRIGSHGSEPGSGCAYLLQDATSGIALAILTELHDGSTLLADEPATKAGADSLDFTRGGALDLTSLARPRADFALLSGFASGNGLYLINSVVDLNTIQVRELGGAVPSSWPVESGSVKILRARFLGVGSTGFSGSGLVGSTPFEFHDDSTGEPLLNLFGWGGGTVLEAYDASGVKRSELRSDGTFVGETIVVTPNVGSETAPAFRVQTKPDPSVGSLADHFAISDRGHIQIGRTLVEDWFLRPTADKTKWIDVAPGESRYRALDDADVQAISGDGGALSALRDYNPGASGGWVAIDDDSTLRLTLANTVNDAGAGVKGPGGWRLVEGVTYLVRFRPHVSLEFANHRFGLLSTDWTTGVYFSLSSTSMSGVVRKSDGGNEALPNLILGPVAGTWYEARFTILSSTKVFFEAKDGSGVLTVSPGVDTSKNCYPFILAYATNAAANSRILNIDRFIVSDRAIVTGKL